MFTDQEKKVFESEGLIITTERVVWEDRETRFEDLKYPVTHNPLFRYASVLPNNRNFLLGSIIFSPIAIGLFIASNGNSTAIFFALFFAVFAAVSIYNLRFVVCASNENAVIFETRNLFLAGKVRRIIGKAIKEWNKNIKKINSERLRSEMRHL